MKTLFIYTIFIFLLGSQSIWGQQEVTVPTTVKKNTSLTIDKSNVKVKRHTVMSRFDMDIASSEEERMKKKQARIADAEYKLSVIDTLDISERKRKMLLHDLKHNPFSDRLIKATLADTKFEDTSSN